MSARALEGIDGRSARWPKRSAEERPVLVARARACAARAAERAVSGRRAPGIATTPGERPSSQASATSAGVAPRRCAIATSCRRRASPAARRGPPSGECAITRDPGLRAALDDAAAERPVVERAQRDLDGGDRRELERLVELRAVDVRRPRRGARALRRRAAPARAPTSARASADRARGAGRGRSGGRRARRGSPRSRRGSPSPGRRAPMRRRPASCRPSSRSAPSPRRRMRRSAAGEQPLVVAELRVAVAVRAGGVEDGDARLGGGGDRRRARAPRRGPRPSRGACSRGRCGAPTGQAIQARSGRGGYADCGRVAAPAAGRSRRCRWYASRPNDGLGLYLLFLIPPLIIGFAVQHWLKKTVAANMQIARRERAHRRRRRAADPRPQRAPRRPRRDVARWAALRPLRPAPEVRAPLGAGLRRPFGRLDRDRGARGRPRDPAREGLHPVPGALRPVAGRRVRVERLVLPPADRHVRSGAGTDPARDPALRGGRALPARDACPSSSTPRVGHSPR